MTDKRGTAATTERRSPDDGYIVSWSFDLVFFIGAPVLALALGAAVGLFPSESRLVSGGAVRSHAELGIAIFIAAHLFIVFFRSHLDTRIFQTHPLRFTVVPIALFTAIMASRYVAVTIAVLGIWWDVYHSGLQTFGLGRIYDARAGNDLLACRRLDFAFNTLLYVGPILGGASLMAHARSFELYAAVDLHELAALAPLAERNASLLTAIVLAIGVPFLGYYFYEYRRLLRTGYRLPRQKVWLYGATSIVSIAAWGFGSFGQAFFIMNFFHAWQYFALVWSTEKTNIARAVRLDQHLSPPMVGFVAIALLAGTGFAYGYWETHAEKTSFAIAAALTVSILHFWYDGFIWSVQKKQV